MQIASYGKIMKPMSLGQTTHGTNVQSVFKIRDRSQVWFWNGRASAHREKHKRANKSSGLTVSLPTHMHWKHAATISVGANMDGKFEVQDHFELQEILLKWI